MADYKEFLSFALRMAQAAGEVHSKYFRTSHLSQHTKQNEYDVVTVADKEAETVIIDMIRTQYPTHGILSEESFPASEQSEWRWVIDPLDGTTNFSQGLPVFCVSIALEHYGQTVVGVVYAAYLNELFYAVKGEGAFFNEKKIKCSDKKNLSSAVLATGMPYDKATNPDNNLKEIAALATMVRGVRRLGSAAMDLAYVAAGYFDGYWELNINHWDVAAGSLIAEEAGAVVLPIRKGRGVSILAANPSLSDTLFEIVARKED